MIRSDRRIAIGAVIVAILAITGIWLTGRQSPAFTASDNTQIHRNRPHRPVQYYAASSHNPEHFPFDPNTADSTQLLRLGLQPWQVRSIYKYRAHGGIYRRKEDFARLYGLTVKQYRELEPYIRISADYQPAASLVKEKPFGIDSVIYPKKIDTTQRVVLNTADSLILRSVPGIGKHFAFEIMKYGQRLGGYVSVDQLDEIDYFPKEAKKYFVIENASPRKLNLNRLTLRELRRHPYINYYQAKAIADYRRLHGNLHSLQDLSLSKDFPPEAILRLTPYVEF